jgi:hypothetical protein
MAIRNWIASLMSGNWSRPSSRQARTYRTSSAAWRHRAEQNNGVFNVTFGLSQFAHVPLM